MSPRFRSWIEHQFDARPGFVVALRRVSAFCGAFACVALFTAGAPGEQALNNVTSADGLTALGGWSQSHLNALVAIVSIAGLVISNNLSWKHAARARIEDYKAYHDLAESNRAIATAVSEHRAAIDRRPCGALVAMRGSLPAPPEGS